MTKAVIYKYPLNGPHTNITVFSGPIGEVIHVGEQDGELFVWILHYDTSGNPYNEFVFKVFGTGHSIEEPTYFNSEVSGTQQKHIGTVQMKNGLVWHIFEIYGIMSG